MNYLRTGAGILFLLFALFGGILVNNAIVGLFPKELELVADSLGTIGHVGFFLLMIYLASKVENKPLREYGIWNEKGKVRLLSDGLLLGIVIFLVAVFPLYVTNLYSLGAGDKSLMNAVNSFIVFIAVGTTEELFFRGYVQHHLLKYGPIKAMLIAAVTFAGIHGLNPNITIISLLNIFLVGLLFSTMMYATGSILTPIGAHITWNWLQGSVLGIPVSGQEEAGFFKTVIGSNHPLLTGGQFGAEGSLFLTITLLIVVTLWFTYLLKSGKMTRYRTKVFSD